MEADKQDGLSAPGQICLLKNYTGAIDLKMLDNLQKDCSPDWFLVQSCLKNL